ncbi:glycosyltransferase [Clostridium oceanicum]|uniref:Glycosyltransferase n=1 Tax=Clostridium oceanicum TaxID=1543 RepID=A0ABP3V881_9CLOT
MKVLFCIRSDYYRNFSEDSIQMLKMLEYLKSKGAQVDINDGNIYDYSSYDIVHLFNLSKIGETYKYYKLAKKYKKKIVLSPLYWDYSKYYKYIDDEEDLKLWKKCNLYRLEVLRGSSIIYVNSKCEGELIKNNFEKNIEYKVIYTGVDLENEGLPLYSFKERHNLNNFILSIGRISRSNNQLMLAKVCNDLDYNLLLIGNVYDTEYYNKCMKYYNVLRLKDVDNYDIYNAYKFAKVYVQPSFLQTSYISCMQAALHGCNIITSNSGVSKEYFKDMATYFDPYNYESMYKAISSAYKKRKNDNLRNHVLKNYKWETSLEKLYKSYIEILDKKCKKNIIY